MTKPRILVLDLETRPALAYSFQMYDTSISPAQVVEAGGVICVGAKWVGGEAFFYSDWQHGHKKMLRAVHKLIMEADAVVSYNGGKFDLPKLSGEFLLNGLPPMPPVTSIDLYKVIRKQGYEINKLEYVGPLLELGQKIKHEGFKLWRGVMEGDPAAEKRMERYCRGDVRLTEQLYKRILPFIANHPHMSLQGRGTCGACGSKELQSRGYRRTKAFRIQRLQCLGCGSWQDGTRTKV